MKYPSYFLFWWRWLVAVTFGLLLFGITLFVAPALARHSFALLLFSSSASLDALGQPAVAYITLLHAVLGAVIAGWSVTLLFVVLGPFRRGSKESWRIVVISLLAWFLPDTVFSLWSGFWQNAVLNAALALLFALPLAATYPAFDAMTDESVRSNTP
jgi:uncharacterized protein YjeT (DUF2065 family)